MRRSLLTAVLLAIVSPAGPVSQAPSADAGDATIWHRQPAPQWDHATPVGNGRLGAMVFGAVNRERIQLNEESLWMPSGDPAERDNPEALKNLPEVRPRGFAGPPREAFKMAE